MSNDRWELTSDLDPWKVTLNTGEVLRVHAHGFSEREGSYVFVALMDGSPPYEYELLRLPLTAVADIVGG